MLIVVTDGRGLAVSNASWHAAYDIQVKMDGSDRPVTLIYKASIVQNTGEVSSGCASRSSGASANHKLYSARTGKMLGSCWKRQRPPLG